MACMYAAHHDWPCTAHAHTASNSIPTQHRDATDWPYWLALTPHSVAARCPPACPPGPAVSSIATGFLAFSGCSLVRAVVVPGSASHAMVMSLLHGGQRRGARPRAVDQVAPRKSRCVCGVGLFQRRMRCLNCLPHTSSSRLQGTSLLPPPASGLGPPCCPLRMPLPWIPVCLIPHPPRIVCLAGDVVALRILPQHGERLVGMAVSRRQHGQIDGCSVGGRGVEAGGSGDGVERPVLHELGVEATLPGVPNLSTRGRGKGGWEQRGSAAGLGGSARI